MKRLLAIALIAGACTNAEVASVPPVTPSATERPTLTAGSESPEAIDETAAPTPPKPANTPIPSPTPLPSDLVWFAPNMGSTDYAELFTKPDQWSEARANVDVFKFYTQNVNPHPCSICGNNTLGTFIEVRAFERLMTWGIAISVEVGAVKEWGCTGEMGFGGARDLIQGIQAHGGSVPILAMDEPLLGGQLVSDGRTCGHTMKQSAIATSTFVDRISAEYPHIVVGDIEPYPHFSVSDLKQWTLALAESGVTPAFFHLDVDTERVRVEDHDVASDLRDLGEFFHQHGIPFGIIFTSNWTKADSSRGYYESTMEWVHAVHEAIGAPAHVVFQSWQGPAPSGAHEVPINLPENDPETYSHTRLINDGLADL